MDLDKENVNWDLIRKYTEYEVDENSWITGNSIKINIVDGEYDIDYCQGMVYLDEWKWLDALDYSISGDSVTIVIGHAQLYANPMDECRAIEAETVMSGRVVERDESGSPAIIKETVECRREGRLLYKDYFEMKRAPEEGELLF